MSLTLCTIWLSRNFWEVLGGVVYGTWRLENAFKDSKEAASNPLSNIWKSLYLLTLWLHNYNRNCHIINSYCRLGFWATPPFNTKGKVTLEIYDQAYLLQGITEAQRLNSKLDFCSKPNMFLFIISSYWICSKNFGWSELTDALEMSRTVDLFLTLILTLKPKNGLQIGEKLYPPAVTKISTFFLEERFCI